MGEAYDGCSALRIPLVGNYAFRILPLSALLSQTAVYCPYCGYVIKMSWRKRKQVHSVKHVFLLVGPEHLAVVRCFPRLQIPVVWQRERLEGDAWVHHGDRVNVAQNKRVYRSDQFIVTRGDT